MKEIKEKHVEILVEESSMESFLRVLLPNILPDGYQVDVNCFIRAHEGKWHLQKEIPKKVKAYRHIKRPCKVIVIQDQNSSDCKKLKNSLIKLITDNADIPFLVRIVCRELEAFYLGDMRAVEKVYPKFKADKFSRKAKFRNPDNCNAFEEIKKLIPGFQKVYASKEISKYISIECNKSTSFKHLVTGIQRFLN